MSKVSSANVSPLSGHMPLQYSPIASAFVYAWLPTPALPCPNKLMPFPIPPLLHFPCSVQHHHHHPEPRAQRTAGGCSHRHEQQPQGGHGAGRVHHQAHQQRLGAVHHHHPCHCHRHQPQGAAVLPGLWLQPNQHGHDWLRGRGHSWSHCRVSVLHCISPTSPHAKECHSLPAYLSSISLSPSHSLILCSAPSLEHTSKLA